MNQIKLILIILLTAFSVSAYCQDVDTVKYTPEFEFEDGIMLTFANVKFNSPLPLARILTNLDKDEVDFYTKLWQEKALSYFDENGVKQEVKTKTLWGFSRNGVLYIRRSGSFHRVTIVGGICHFVATVYAYDSRYNNPYYSNPYYNNYGYGNPYYTSRPYNSASQEVKQFLIDFESGRIYDYDVEVVEILLMKDPELHDEFMALSNRKKKQLKFFYIRKFNERNPIFLPVKKKF